VVERHNLGPVVDLVAVRSLDSGADKDYLEAGSPAAEADSILDLAADLVAARNLGSEVDMGYLAAGGHVVEVDSILVAGLEVSDSSLDSSVPEVLDCSLVVRKVVGVDILLVAAGRVSLI
jgi:hypothetical protein